MVIKDKFDLAEDIEKNQIILDKLQDETYAQNMYAAFCNTSWQKIDFMEMMEDNVSWEVSWRAAGRIIANLRNKGEAYLDFYCSGMIDCADENRQYVPEGTVTDEIREDLKSIGWREVIFGEK